MDYVVKQDLGPSCGSQSQLTKDRTHCQAQPGLSAGLARQGQVFWRRSSSSNSRTRASEEARDSCSARNWSCRRAGVRVGPAAGSRPGSRRLGKGIACGHFAPGNQPKGRIGGNIVAVRNLGSPSKGLFYT